MNVEKSTPLFKNSLECYLENMFIMQGIASATANRSPGFLEVACGEFLKSLRGDMDEYFKFIEALSLKKHDVAISGAEILVNSLIRAVFDRSESLRDSHRA